MAKYEVTLKKIEPITVASLRQVVRTYPDVGELHDELYTHFQRQGIRETAPCLSVWHDGEYRPRDVDAEAAFPVAPGSIQSNGRIKVRELPGVELAACVVHRGPFERLQEAYDSLIAWIEANGYRIAGPDREVYLRSPADTPDPNQYVTEIQMPVEKR